MMARKTSRKIIFTALLLSTPAAADVVAAVDRASVELNESFTLKLIVDTQLESEPDVSPLESDFKVGSRTQMSNTTILNGEVNRSRTWTFVLMAKRPGDLVIPPISVGSEKSNPVAIKVTPQSTAPPGEADIFITTEVDSENSYVQAQVLYTVRTYRAVATRQPRWSEPAASGVESLVEVAGEEKTYESQLNGKAYNVVERVYAFFPQESGELKIAPARFEARVLRNGRITGRKLFESIPITVVVNPIPAAPADHPDAAWFPAEAVEIRQEWSRALHELPAGEPITRHVTVIAAGQLQTQIPVIEPASPPTIRVYPDKPEERTVAGSTGIKAMRRDQYALIGTQAGTVELPELILPWWNVNAGEWQYASLPATTLTIVPSPNAPVIPPPVEEVLPVEQTERVVVVQSTLWRRIAEGMMVLWLLTLVVWWWSRRDRKRVSSAPAEPPVHKQQARFLKMARKAAAAGDTASLKSAMLAWGRLQWPTDAPRSIGGLAQRVSMPLSVELGRMCSATYGAGDGDWDGESVARALRSFAVLSDDTPDREKDELPPLFPDPAI